MDTSSMDVRISMDELPLCNEALFPPYSTNDLSTDSASTTYPGGGAPYYQYSYNLPGNTQPLEFQNIPTADGCGFFDEYSGLYSQPFALPAPIISVSHSTESPYGNMNDLEPISMELFSKDLLPIPNICQETPFTERLNQDAASSQLMISELDRSLPSDIFHLSSVQSSLSSHPQQMEQPHICTSELLEPSITIGSSLWSDPIVKEETLSRRSSPNRSNDEFQGTTRNRWKPNSRQLYYLEQHFRTGYTKATPELYKAVQDAGPGTESQVQVWLKNRLARCKRQPKIDLRSEESTNLDVDSMESLTGNKRSRQVDDLGTDFGQVQKAVLNELSSILQSVNPGDMTGLIRAIRSANRICCYGVSREGLVLKAFSINLHNLGFNATFVGDTNAPSLTTGDLFIVAAGPSYYSTVNALSLEAMRAGAQVVAFTAHKTAPLPYVDIVIRIASQTLPPTMAAMHRRLGCTDQTEMVSSLPEGRCSIMQMGASFEIALSLVLESLCVMLRKKLNLATKDMMSRTSNLK